MCMLSVNIDHVATVREARGVSYPDPAHAATLAELGGADGITVHLRGDQRHINIRDVRVLADVVGIPLTIEMEPTEEMMAFASGIKPSMVTLVPERPGEISTEGGLDLVSHGDTISLTIASLRDSSIRLCGFVDPNVEQIQAAAQIGLNAVELCTARYAESDDFEKRAEELDTLTAAARLASRRGLEVRAGHGLTYTNVSAVAAIDEFTELSIGHSIIARAIMIGLDRAVREMKDLIWKARIKHSGEHHKL